MRIFFLVVLGILTVSGALADSDDECLLKAESKCGATYVPAFDGLRHFPTSLEEVRKDCSKFYEKKQCADEFFRNCSVENAEDNENDHYYSRYDENDKRIKDKQEAKANQMIIDVRTQICDENSELHRSFVPHLSCIKATIEESENDGECEDYERNAVEYLGPHIESKARMASGSEEQYRKVRNGLMYCLRRLIGINCLINTLKTTCDSGVEQPLLEIIDKGVSLYYLCPPATRMGVIELLDDLKMISRQRIFVHKILLDKSRF